MQAMQLLKLKYHVTGECGQNSPEAGSVTCQRILRMHERRGLVAATSMDGTGRRLGTSGRLKPQETKESLVHKLTEVVRNEVLRAFEESP